MSPFRTAPAVAASLLALVVGAACTSGGADDPEPDPADTSGSGGDDVGGSSPVTETEGGAVRGVRAQGMRSWLGVPYAAPPVDDLRWRPPQPVEPWSGTRAADIPGPTCVQAGGGSSGVGPSSEDCLHLNVYRPDSDARDLPVLVYLHGGGLRLGSGALPPEHVSRTVRKGLVLVTLNYRLGRLGYFAHPALAEESREDGERPVANFGLLDQISALTWVKENIAAFGGNPDQVTIHGMSAGGASVNYLMASPRAKGLFHRAVSQSGLGGQRPIPYREAADRGEEFAAQAGAPDADAAALRALDANAVARMPADMLDNDIPILDPVLPQPVADAFSGGEEADVPYLVGTTDRELPDPALASLGMAPDAVRQRILDRAGGEAVAAYGDAESVRRHLLSDVVFTEPARTLARAHAHRAPSYRYRFAITDPGTRSAHGGALHSTDLNYAFGVPSPNVRDGARLAAGFSRCFATFVKTGTPRCGIDWPTAEDDGLVEFTNDGPQVHDVDPWRERLDLVADLTGG